MGAASARAAADGAGEPLIELPFSAFYSHPVGPRGLEPSEQLRRAVGHRVRLVGYMVQQEQPQPGQFRLSAQPVQLSENADGAADDLSPATVTVLLDVTQAGRVIAHQPGLLASIGRLEFGRIEHADGRVSWLRLRLEADAVAKHASRPATLTAASTAR